MTIDPPQAQNSRAWHLDTA